MSSTVRRHLYSFSAPLALALPLALCGCGDEEPPPPAPDAAPPCEVGPRDCPNSCAAGVGRAGESCLDSSSCACGLSCSEGVCAPYAGALAGCLCDGVPAAAPPSFTLDCAGAPDGAPCNDLNPCTLDDACAAGACVGEPARFAAACDDGNPCTTNDVCAGAVCQGVDKLDGERCEDGDPCTEGDVCAAGRCGGAPKSCEGEGDQCNLGVCDPLSGACLRAPRPAGERCDDGDYCTLNDSCEAGVCRSSERVDCRGQESACVSASCDPRSGACVRAPRADGLFCEADDDACTQEECREGVCALVREVRCEDLCNDGACDPRTGLCQGRPLADGTPCDDQDACTENRECLGGRCHITALLCACDGLDEGALCDDNDPCTRESRCDAERACVPVRLEPAGAPCEGDGDLCTQGGACDAEGACVGEEPLDCAAEAAARGAELGLGDCLALSCDGRTGSCLPAAAPEGAPCEVADPCHEPGACSAGECVAAPRDCAALDHPCGEGVCDPALNDCVARDFPEGTPCSDGDLCTGATRCAGAQGSAACVEALPSPADLCGLCEGQPLDAPCDDGDPCTANDRCARRGALVVCVGEAVVCEAPEELPSCHAPLCDPLSGACGAALLPFGAPCDDLDPCTVQDRCDPLAAAADPAAPLCAGRDLNAEPVTCAGGGSSLLNPGRVGDEALVSSCEPTALAVTREGPHDLDALHPGAPRRMRVLASLSLDAPEDWLSVALEEGDLLSAAVTDRCGAPVAASVEALDPAGALDLSPYELPATASRADLLSLYAPAAGVYLLRVRPARALEARERLPYVLSVERGVAPSCASDLDCCDEQRCADGDGDGLLACAPAAPVEEEPNDRPAGAARLNFAGAARARALGALTSALDADWHKVRLEAGHTYALSTSSYCGVEVDTALAVFEDQLAPAPRAQPVLSNDDRTDDEALLYPRSSRVSGLTPAVTMDYFVRVSPGAAASVAPFGYYSLTVDDVSCRPALGAAACSCEAQRCLPTSEDPLVGQCVPTFSEREPNQTTDEAAAAQGGASRLLRDAPTYGVVSRVGDKDTFLVDLPAGRFVVETLAYCGERPLNTALRVRSAAGLTVAEDFNSGGEGLSRIAALTLAAPERVAVEVSGEGGAVGPYLVRVSTLELLSPATPGGEGGLCDVDADCACADLVCAAGSCAPARAEREPNDSPAAATPLPLNARVSGTLSAVGDLDSYRLDVTAAQVGARLDLRLDLPCSGAELAATLRLLSPAGAVLRVGAPAADALALIEGWAPTAPGSYTLVVEGLIAARGSYVISATPTASAAWRPLGARVCAGDADCGCPLLRCDAPLGQAGACVSRVGAEVEPNDEPASARPLRVSALGVAELLGDLSASADVDSFSLSVPEGEEWAYRRVELVNPCAQPTAPRLALRLFDPSGALTASAEGAAGSAELLLPRWLPARPGVHRLEVRLADGAPLANLPSSYLLRVAPEASCDPLSSPEDLALACGCAERECAADAAASAGGVCARTRALAEELEPNDLASYAVSLSAEGAPFLGAELYARLSGPGDADHFSFRFTDAQRGALFSATAGPFCGGVAPPLSLALSREGAPAAPVDPALFRVYDAGALTLRAALGAPPEGARVSPTAGEYVLRVEPVSCAVDADCLCAEATCAGGACLLTDPEVEPNDDPAQARLVPLAAGGAALTRSGALSAPAPSSPALDRDHYAVAVQAADLAAGALELVAEVGSSCGEEAPPRAVTVYYAADPAQPSTNDVLLMERAGAGEPLRVSARAEAPGLYLVRVSPADALSAPGPYALTLSLRAAP